MAGYETVRQSELVRAIPELLANLSDLIQKELRLARAELNRGLLGGVRAGVWMAVAAVLGLIAVVLIAQAIVFGIASAGIPLHWSSLIVAVLFGAAAGVSFLMGRGSVPSEDLAATRTMRQLSETIKTTKEQLT
jgi:Putative Actinobacterial Holin-X, holin superfamily III